MMPADRLLNTVLELLQSVHDGAKTDQIAGSATSLLSTLHNPLNLGVLTTQLLTAPALWRRHGEEPLRAAVRVLSIYNSAALRVRQRAAEQASASSSSTLFSRAWPFQGHQQSLEAPGLDCDAWARGVVKGLDARSARWQHVLVLAGVQLGMRDENPDGDRRPGLSRGLSSTLQEAVVTAVNLALRQGLMADGPVAAASLVLALSYIFSSLDERYRQRLDCDALLPVLLWAVTGEEGFARGEFLRNMDGDVRQVGGRLVWLAGTRSADAIARAEAQPLMGRMGPVAVMAGFAIQHARNVGVVVDALDALVDFSRAVLAQWGTSVLSNVDRAEEQMRLSPDTLQGPWSALWLLLQKVLYASVVILQAIVSRGLLDKHLRNEATAPIVATKVLRVLRNLFFISSRPGNSSTEIYSFTYLASLDVLSRFPEASIAFLTETQPTPPGRAVPPANALSRTMDLYHLNVSEHLPLHLPLDACDRLVVQPALAYLSLTGSAYAPGTVELFESAHSAILSVMSCPNKSALAAGVVPFYVDRLLASFPAQMSTRQFRLAFKTAMQIVSPPHPIAATHPGLSETLMEMLLFRAGTTAGTSPLPPGPEDTIPALLGGPPPPQPPPPREPLSEQSSLVLALIDSLPYLPLPLVEEWLDRTARAVGDIADPVLREPARRRLWDVLVSGEMDVERAALGVTWWGTHGGRELVLGRSALEAPLMSGALMDNGTSSRL